MGFMRAMGARLRAEDGVAVVVAVGALLVVSMFAALLSNGALRLSGESNRGTQSKRALAAADSGVNLATQRLSNTALEDTYCLSPAAPPGPTGCPMSTPETLGNGARFSYAVSPVLTPATDASCTSSSATPALPWLKQRCVTSLGEVNGQRRVVQTRLIERLAPIFPFVGMVGLNSIRLNQSNADGIIGSNGTITVGPQSRVRNPGDVRLGPSGSIGAGGPASSWGPVTTNPEAYAPDLLADHYEAAENNHVNSQIASQPGVTLDAGRRLTLGPGSLVTLQSGGIYSLCSIRMNSNGRLRVPASATAPVRLFVDSSYRAGSGCAPNGDTNVINVASGGGFVNETGKASMFQVFVYGGPVNQNIVFNSSADFVGTLYAPQSGVVFNSGASIVGAMIARDVEFRNNDGDPGFSGDPDAMNAGVPDGTYERKAWRECPAVSGC